MYLKFIVLITISLHCIGALKDRVLFSIGEEYIFANKANLYLSVLSEAKCPEQLKYLFELSDIQEKVSIPALPEKSLKERTDIHKTLMIFKVLNAARSELEKNTVGNVAQACGNFSKDKNKALKELVLANDYVKQRLTTFAKDQDPKNSIQVFIQSFIDPIDVRIFY